MATYLVTVTGDSDRMPECTDVSMREAVARLAWEMSNPFTRRTAPSVQASVQRVPDTSAVIVVSAALTD